ncbi:hypothetical protein QBC33DRAFT_545771 [Phialemonium atrogriseum]|uniref:CFEM domain-containing protein n=1 Tax=Phialemonium atrogriseum TaxID=1093897 RepID=A0AAJ0BXX5_9PEZI|nr:uncharacterized protein QBC33DRAFT_545771 [Phialemonium atrogriseum]KAK1765112.1 hypothetical protein QBC33DRAFT_545771 [Phialemonium atrogriseum]
MRLILWAVFAITGLAALSQAQTMPTCASDCLTTHLKESSCDPTDFECICADQTLMGDVEICSMGTCTVVEGLAARNATATLCKEPVRDRSLVAPIATAVSAAIALAFVLMRMYECYVRKEYQWTDLCAVLAMVSSVPMDAFEFFMMADGFGKDIWTLTPEQITNVVKYTWITQVTYIPAIILTKVAIICFFMRVFPGRGTQMLCIGTIVHCMLFMVTTTITAILACVPVQYARSNWAGTGEGVCYHNTAFWWAHSAINITTDLWILALPVPQLLKLQLGKKKKVYLILMISVGIIITVVSVVRFSGLVTYSATSNPTYNNVMVATYSVIECNVSIMCCCMPCLPAFLRRVFPDMFGSTDQSDYKAGSYNVVKSPFQSNAFPSNTIQKSVTHSVSYMPRAGDSDVVELMDIEEKKQKQYHQW